MDRAPHDRASEGRPLHALIVTGAAMLALCVAMLRLMIVGDRESFVIAALAQGAVYAAGVWLVVRRAYRRGPLYVIVGVALLARVIALPSPPTLSDDVYRYVWDGRVQAAGINPYRYVPADEHLAALRDNEIYPNINRKDYAPTIYPPVAQMIFLVVSRVSETLTAMKVAMLGFDMLAIVTILVLLRQDGAPLERVLVYAWHPLPIWEFAGTGHVDAAPIALMCLAMLASARDRRGIAGALLALGSLIKPFPLAIAPALWRPWDFRMPAAFIAVAVACYVPYLGAGWQVLGFLGGYNSEEHYLGGDGFFLVSLLRGFGFSSLSGPAYVLLAFAALAALAGVVSLRRRSPEIDRTALLVLGASFLILTSPHYPWYFVCVVPLLALRIYVPLLYLTLASPILYIIEPGGDAFRAGMWLYGGFAAFALIDALARVKRSPIGRTA
jgi:alpha-1,6-mannosyltransferase